jgi:hypothetical protein
VLLDPHDPAAAAATVARLLRSPGELERLGRRAREGMRGDYSVARELAQMQAIYASLLEGRGLHSQASTGAAAATGRDSLFDDCVGPAPDRTPDDLSAVVLGA